jgi:putative ABC transport system ATP-binding protein
MDTCDSRPIIVAKELSKRVVTQHADLTILSGVSLEIKRGESLAIVGVSGSGKSTLLGLLAGLDEPSSGEVELCGQSLLQLDEDGRAGLRGAHVGFVFQSFQLLPNLTARENVALPLEIGGGDYDQAHMDHLLARVGLADRQHHYPSQLSGGEQQRVAIARAFVTSPALLFADEPTGNLDAVTGATIIELLFELNRTQQTTLVMVTHDEMLAQRCDRQVRLEGGRLTA